MHCLVQSFNGSALVHSVAMSADVLLFRRGVLYVILRTDTWPQFIFDLVKVSSAQCHSPPVFTPQVQTHRENSRSAHFVIVSVTQHGAWSFCVVMQHHGCINV